jgi:hypothetical protein
MKRNIVKQNTLQARQRTERQIDRKYLEKYLMSDKLRAVTFVGDVEAETVKTLLNCFGLTVKSFTRTN